MGVQGLTTLIKRYAPDSMNTVSFGSCRGSVISVDTSILLYKFRYAAQKGRLAANTSYASRRAALQSEMCYASISMGTKFFFLAYISIPIHITRISAEITINVIPPPLYPRSSSLE